MKIICVYNEKEDLLNVLFGKPDLEIKIEKDRETGCELELSGDLSRALWRCLKKTYSPNQIEIVSIPNHYGYNVVIKKAMNREVEMSMYGVGDEDGRLCEDNKHIKDAAWVLGSITESMCKGRSCQNCPCDCADENECALCVAAHITGTVQDGEDSQIKIL